MKKVIMLRAYPKPRPLRSWSWVPTKGMPQKCG